jgi:DNA polymerase I
MEFDKEYEDLSNNLLKEAYTLKEVKECEIKFNREFNPRSTLMLRWLLLERYNLPVLKTKKTPKGEENPVLDAKAMKVYASKHKNKYCQIMEKYRSYQTLRENFLSGMLPKLIDNVAHTTYSLHSTATGRPNSKDPNLLNLPGGKETKKIKQAFIARPGYIFVYGDLSQIEVKVAAVVYEEPNLIDICNRGGDFHCEITSRILGIPYEVVFEGKESGDEEIINKRRIFKSIVFGILYQEGPAALARSLGLTVSEAEDFIREFFKGFPSLEKNIELTKREVIKNGYLTNLFGFRRSWKYHSEEDHSTLREAVNFKVQSVAWNLLELGLIKIDSKLKEMKSELVIQVYDSIGVEAVEEERKKVARIMKKAMETVNRSIPKLDQIRVTADVEMGYNLAELEKVA